MNYFARFWRALAGSPPAGRASSILGAAERYQRLRRTLFIILLSIGILPLGVMASLSFIQYRALLRAETIDNARLSAESAGHAIEAHLEKLTTAVRIISDAYPYQDLVDQEKLDQVYARLKEDFPGVVDLSVIGADGIQRTYAGPYNLAGKNYSLSIWYNRTLARKMYLSEVFLGYRHVPHFVIAIGKTMPGGRGHWVLRASIDSERLNLFLAPIFSGVVRDVFLVNHAGKLQSASRRHGKVSDKIRLPDIPPLNAVLVNEGDAEGSYIQAFGHIRNTPWLLVMELKGYAAKGSWLGFKRQLLAIFLACLAIVIMVAFRVAHQVAQAVRKADEERNAVIAKTEHTNKLASIGRLAAGVAHEINNPLAIINEKAGLMMDLLERSEGFAHRDKFLGQLSSVMGAVDRSRTITHRLLGFARRMEARLEPVDVNEVIEEVLGFLGKEALYHGIEISRELAPKPPLIRSDRGQLQQIFLNIVNNAIDAVGNNGEIRIVTARKGDNLESRIIDNGPGMPPEVLGKIFEPFFSTKTGNEAQGAGLGLSITYGLVKKLGGDILVDSTVGRGTTFTLVFPVLVKNKGESINE